MQKNLTIIVPTYNMENYLDKCLSSFIVSEPECQLMLSLEVLVVNDGSTDRSSEIAHRYEKRYPETFKVIDKENGNYGSCINAALPVAIGKYVKVIDADDSAYTKNLGLLLSTMAVTDTDLFLSNTITVDEEENQVGVYGYTTNHENPLKTYLSEMLDDQNFCRNIRMHNVAYRTDILRQINYEQTEGISHTDNEWIFLPMTSVDSVFIFPYTIYKYLSGRSGQTVSPDQRHLHFSDEVEVAFSLLSKNKDLVASKTGMMYAKQFLLEHLRILYHLEFCGFYYKLSEFAQFDKRIKKEYPEIYAELGRKELLHNFKIETMAQWLYPYYCAKMIKRVLKNLLHTSTLFYEHSTHNRRWHRTAHGKQHSQAVSGGERQGDNPLYIRDFQ